jgi:hypothetical protein
MCMFEHFKSMFCWILTSFPPPILFVYKDQWSIVIRSLFSGVFHLSDHCWQRSMLSCVWSPFMWRFLQNPTSTRITFLLGDPCKTAGIYLFSWKGAIFCFALISHFSIFHINAVYLDTHCVGFSYFSQVIHLMCPAFLTMSFVFLADICSGCSSFQPANSYECWLWWKNNSVGCESSFCWISFYIAIPFFGYCLHSYIFFFI